MNTFEAFQTYALKHQSLDPDTHTGRNYYYCALFFFPRWNVPESHAWHMNVSPYYDNNNIPAFLEYVREELCQ